MALGDPSLVRRIERGRSLTLRTADRILAFVSEYDGKTGGTRDPPRRPRYRKPSPRARKTNRSRATTEQPMEQRTNAPTPDSPPVGRCRPARVCRGPRFNRWRVGGRFPRVIVLGRRTVGWIESEVEEWIREQIAESRGGAESAAH